MPSSRTDHLLARLREWVFESSVYDWSLGHDTNGQLLATPPEELTGALSDLEPPDQPALGFDSGHHRFNWLGQSIGQSQRLHNDDIAIFQSWLENFDRWDSIAWRTDILGDRLACWLTHYGAISSVPDDAFVEAWRRSLRRQARHLLRAISMGGGGDGIAALRGAVFCTLFLPGMRARIDEFLSALEREVAYQVNADGGHRDRNPRRHMVTLVRLLHIRDALHRSDVESPTFLQIAIDRMVPVLRTYRHGDGRLCLFNGSTEHDPNAINRVIDKSDSRGRAASSVPHTGFHRLSANRTTLLFDVGAPIANPPLSQGHAGTLAFEMCVGKQRLIVNCGSATGRLGEALRATAAHSTLIVDDSHSADLIPEAGFGQRRPEHVDVRRRESERHVLVEARHDGYVPIFGLIHRRSLYLSADGREVRGEDIVQGAGSGQKIDLRFHLHPAVRASLTSAGDTVLLRFGRTGGWRFHATGGSMALDDSVYCGTGASQRTTQIVLSTQHEGLESLFKWRINREA